MFSSGLQVLLSTTGWLVLGSMLGAAVHHEYRRRRELAKRRIPRQWPLLARPLVNSRERLIWRWLLDCFPEQQILVKLPVTRFTRPSVQDEGQHWFRLINGVYCTFTVCSRQGQVLGCIDVPGPRGLSLGNQTLKHSLLTQCAIRYYACDPDHLPAAGEIRVAILGEQALMQDEIERMRSDGEFWKTRASLQAALSRQRHSHVPAQPAAADDPHHVETYDAYLSTQWRHDSFVMPLDSRIGELA